MNKLTQKMPFIIFLGIFLVNQVLGIAQATHANARNSEMSPSSIDLRQDGPIQVSGNLVEGGKVYLTIPVKNYGNTASPAVHPYTEGYTSQGDLWRADGAQPSSAVIQPGQRVVFQVKHDLWYGHTGTWSTYGVYLWNNSTGTYYQPLNTNGHNQQISFQVQPASIDLRQDGPIQVSGNLVEGGKVYLTIPVKNYGNTASPAVHPYTEGYTSQGDLWRADGAQPSSAVIQPGQRAVFQVEHDLWYGHTGTWSTYGVYLWNNSTGTYYQPLNANGHNQQISFQVQAVGADIRQDGPIKISGSLQQGSKVYLQIPVKNYGNTASPAVHPYTEGYTSQGALWRADGAQPSSAIIQPGQRVVFQVEHDLWYGHVGTWETYGVYLWNNSESNYYGPLASNGYNQAISFAVADTPLQSLDIQYLDDSNRAIDIDYDVVQTLPDGSLVVNLTVSNKLHVPYMMRIWTFGNVSDPDGKLERFEDFSQAEAFPILPKTTIEFRNVHFHHGSYIEFHFPMFGYDNEDRNFIYGLHGIEILSIAVFGFIPTGDAFETYENLISGGLGIFAESIGNVNIQFFIFGEKLGQGDIGGALETLANILSSYADEMAKAFNAIFKTSVSAGVIRNLSLVSVIWNGSQYLWDLSHAPGFAQVTIVPSPRPADGSSLLHRTTTVQNGPSIIASSSEQGIGWSQIQIADGDISTGWASASETLAGEWIIIHLSDNTPVRIESIQINPGPTSGDHSGAALKNFHVDASLDGFNFTTILSGSFTSSDLGETKSFAISPTIAAYIRLVVDNNQSDNAVQYVNIAEISVTGCAYSSADEFEPDSDTSFANLINSSGIAQIHNIHYPGDIDWFRLQAVENETYMITTQMLGSDAKMLVEVFNSDASTMLYSNTVNLSLSFDWNALMTGDYLIRISHLDDQAYGIETTYSLSSLLVRSKIFLPVIISSGK